MLSVVHIITGLEPDGAEQMLYNLIARTQARRIRNEVISLTSDGPVGEALRRVGARVRVLGMRSALPNPLLVGRLASWLRESQPNLVHTWMYHANLIGGVAARLALSAPVIWAVHHADLESGRNKRRTIWTARAGGSFSRTAKRIVYCSQSARRVHERIGYDPAKSEVVPNGFDTVRFRPNAEARQRSRRELGIPANAVVIGMAARLDPAKDHGNFFAAAARLHARLPEVRFALCGAGMTADNSAVKVWMKQAGVEDCCFLLGPRSDMPLVYPAFDIATSSSVAEAFPMAVGEAMACGVPCVVTDAGDSALIAGDPDLVAPVRDPDALAARWERLAASARLRRAAGESARARIEERFSLDSVVEAYEKLYGSVAETIPMATIARPASI